jgi:Sulfotransferase domain
MQFNILKHNPFSFFIVNKWLDLQCCNVKGFVFVATTGRSGSSSLAKIFEAVENAVCFHEPHPIMFNDIPPDIDRNKYFRNLFNVKKVYIKRAARRHDYYIETNHQFVKNFSDLALSEFQKKLKVIHLIRTPVESAMSFYQIDSVPGVSERGKLYLLDPADKNNILNMQGILYNDGEFKHDLYKCLWYWYEIEARITAFKKLYSTVPVFKLETLDLNNYTPLEKMFHTLDIDFSVEKLESLVGSKENTKLDQKSRTLDNDEVAYMHNLFFEQLSQMYSSDLWVN